MPLTSVQARQDPKHALIIVRTNVTRDARVLKEARTLWEAGYRVTVLGIRTSREDEPLELREFCTIRRVTTTARLDDLLSAPGGDSADTESPRSSYSGPVGELRHWAGRMRENQLYLEAALPLRPDVVISCDLTALPAGYWLKRRLGCRLVYDAHELFTEMTGARGPVYRFLYKRTEAYLIRRADAVVTVNRLIANELAQRYRVRVPGVVMNGPSEKVESTSEIGWPVRVLYQGGYTPGRGLETLVREAGRLRGAAVLTMQGFGPLERTLRHIADSAGVSDVVFFVEPCAPDEVVRHARDHDIGLVVYQPTGLNNRLSSPNKLFDYMAAGLAIVASELPVACEVLQETGAGRLFNADDVAQAFVRVGELAADKAALIGCKQAALNGIDPFLWDSQAQVLLEAVGGTA